MRKFALINLCNVLNLIAQKLVQWMKYSNIFDWSTITILSTLMAGMFSIRAFKRGIDRNSLGSWWFLMLLLICIRGCLIIIRTGILLHTSKPIAPRDKSQARGQNNWARALKWGIVRLFNSSTFRDTIVFMKMWVFQFWRFCKKIMISLYKNAKNAKS